MSDASSLASCPNVSLAAKVEFLLRPTSYPDRPARVDAIETHMSWVFLTDRYAYKLKKPVRYDFLDFGTVDARRRNCEEEIRLNRRLAPDIYLGCPCLTLEADGTLRLGGTGEPIDWLVEMRRLSADRMLDVAIRERRTSEPELRAAAALLADFYRRSPPVDMSPSDYLRRFEREVSESRRELLVFGLPAETVTAVSAAQLVFLDRDRQVLESRARERRIIEAHGDLRPEHVHLGPPPRIIDCLEFNRDFRLLDPCDELCFLMIECERLGAPGVGDPFFDGYAGSVGDRPAARLLSFYKCFRASLRAKIAIWHLRDPTVTDHAKWRQRA